MIPAALALIALAPTELTIHVETSPGHVCRAILGRKAYDIGQDDAAFARALGRIPISAGVHVAPGVAEPSLRCMKHVFALMRKQDVGPVAYVAGPPPNK